MVPTGVQEFVLYVLGATYCSRVAKILPFSTIAATGYLRTGNVLYLSHSFLMASMLYYTPFANSTTYDTYIYFRIMHTPYEHL